MGCNTTEPNRTDLVAGDTLPAIEVVLLYDEDDPASLYEEDLTGAAVVFDLFDDAGTKVLDAGLGVVSDIAAKQIAYQPGAGESSSWGAGRFRGKFKVTLSGGGVQSFPTKGFYSVVVNAAAP